MPVSKYDIYKDVRNSVENLVNDMGTYKHMNRDEIYCFQRKLTQIHYDLFDKLFIVKETEENV